MLISKIRHEAIERAVFLGSTAVQRVHILCIDRALMLKPFYNVHVQIYDSRAIKNSELATNRKKKIKIRTEVKKLSLFILELDFYI